MTDFAPQVKNLPKLLTDYQIIAWDAPGNGKSTPPGRVVTMDFLHKDADVVKELMDTLGISKFSVLGWSNGGTSAMVLAGKYPDCVEKLIIFGCVSYLTMNEVKIYKYIRDVKHLNEETRIPMEKLYGVEYFKNKYAEHVDNQLRIFKERKGDLCNAFLKDITAETLILFGEKDVLVSKEHPQFLLKNISNSKLISFPNGAHDIHLKYPEDFNEKVANFLAH